MTQQEQHNIDKQFMIECLTDAVIQMLMEDEGLDIQTAMTKIFNYSAPWSLV